MKKILSTLLLVISLIVPINLFAQTTKLQCTSPLVPYQGACVDPIPACKNPPAHHMPSSCIDKIENGVYIERFNFSCMPGYDPVGKECVRNDDPIDGEGADDIDVQDLTIDLTIGIQRIQLMKSKSTMQKRFKVSFVISNGGNDDAVGNIRVSASKEGTVASGDKLITRRGIRAGKKLYTAMYVDYENNNTKFVFAVDPRNEIDESNEENNTVTGLVALKLKK